MRRRAPNLLKLAFLDWAGVHGEILREGMRKLYSDDPLDNWGEIARKVQSGEFEILWLTHDGKTSGDIEGYSIYQVIEHEHGKEFFSVCSFSRFKGFSMATHCLPILEEKARGLGCCSIVMDTLRPALVKVATEGAGFRVSEVRLRKDLN